MHFTFDSNNVHTQTRITSLVFPFVLFYSDCKNIWHKLITKTFDCAHLQRWNKEKWMRQQLLNVFFVRGKKKARKKVNLKDWRMVDVNSVEKCEHYFTKREMVTLSSGYWLLIRILSMFRAGFWMLPLGKIYKQSGRFIVPVTVII